LKTGDSTEKDNGNRKKILHVLPIPFLPLIGPCMRCLRQTRALIRAGMDVTILSLNIRERKELGKLKEQAFRDLRILPVLPNLPTAILREIGSLILSWGKISSHINKIKPDIVHIHNPPDTLAFVTSLVCSIKNIPVVYDIHDGSREVINAAEFNPVLKLIAGKVGFFFEQQTIKRSSGIVTVSESLKTLLLETRKVFRKHKPLFVVMRNVDESSKLLMQRKSLEEQNYIFYSGTLYSKFIGIEFLIDCLEDLLKEGQTELYIAGEGPYRKSLEKYINNKKVHESVKLLGHVRKNDVVDLIARAKLTAIPYERNSLTEIALPNKLFEYMALGKPIVYPDLPGFREVLGDDNGGKYNPDDKKDLSMIVEKMLNSKKLRESVGEKNRELLGKTTFESEFSKLLALYRQILR
jgi:glycosyltransferase involved in cell wall biosynthesis